MGNASSFFHATNTGLGFITAEDTFTKQNIKDDIWEVSGDFQAWVARVGAVPLTTEEETATLAWINNAPIVAQMQLLERDDLVGRPLREMIVANPFHPANAKYEAIDAQVAALRAKLLK